MATSFRRTANQPNHVAIMLDNLDDKTRRTLVDCILLIAILALIIAALSGCSKEKSTPEEGPPIPPGWEPPQPSRRQAMRSIAESPITTTVSFDQPLDPIYRSISIVSWPDGITITTLPACRVVFYTNSAPGYGTWTLPMTYYETNVPVVFTSTNWMLFWRVMAQ